jgi:membrane protease YdiL (CAAX protease family)
LSSEIRRVATFYALAFGIAWGIEGLIYLLGGFTSAALILLYGLGWLAPSIAAGVMVKREGGSPRAHFAQLLRWRPNLLYLLALLLPTAAQLLAGAPFHVATGVFLIGPPLAEEPGWRGYAYDRLRRVWSAFPAALLTGVLWAVWHVPTWFLPGVHADLRLLPAYCVWLTAAGLLAGWFYDRLRLTGSLTFHAGLNLDLAAVGGATVGPAAVILAVLGVAFHLPWRRWRSG